MEDIKAITEPHRYFLNTPNLPKVVQLYISVFLPAIIWCGNIPYSNPNDYACVKLYSCNRIYCILGIGNNFLCIVWFIFLKSDKNLTVIFFFGWNKVEAPCSNRLTFLIPVVNKYSLLISWRCFLGSW